MTPRLARGAVAVALLAATTFLLPDAAHAQLTGGCTATINGSDANAAQSVRAAIAVEENATVEVNGSAPGPITGYKVYLTFAGIRIPAGDGTVSNGETTYRSSVKIADYAKYGVGVYRVEGETQGTPCTGWAYVKVTGKFPLTTLAGVIGLVFTLLGLIGLIFSRPRLPKLPTGGIL